MNAIDTLLESLIDYAGLFPPASLPMEEAAMRYAAYRGSGDRRVLAAFVVPVARVDELLAASSATSDDPWPLSLLWTRGIEQDAPETRRLRRHEARVQVEAVELRAASPEQLPEIAAALDTVAGFVEFPWQQPAAPWIAGLAEHGLRAKIRTGGVTADLIPPVSAVAAFLDACERSRLPFKATAGLHHPVRAVQNLTYEPDAAQAVMHGYLNVFLGALLLATGRVDASELPVVLEEMDPAAFSADRGHMSWRDKSVSVDEIRSLRATWACSFGSCSFTEPLEDLHTLEMR